MPYICFYFQVHQPKRLRKYSFFDIGHNHYYEDDVKNQEVVLKVANKCYLPTNALLLQLIKKYSGRFKIAYSLTGTVIEQFKRFSPQTLDSFKALVDTGCVDLLNETYNHGLSFLFSKELFQEEIALHRELIQKEFGQQPVVFRNTELIYNNDIGQLIADLGYKAMLAEGADKVLGWRSPNYLYQAHDAPQLKLLLKNYRLSDDIAFRFSNKDWHDYPLTADKFAHWVHSMNGHGDIVNLFMDYETFGEHQWEDTGIFNFLSALPDKIFLHPDFGFCTPSEAAEKLTPVAILDVPEFYSWADTERDLTAWRGNHLQEDALQAVYGLTDMIKKVGDADLKKTWQCFLTSDHFYYMCTKWHADGDVHKYFNPYRSPYEAFINFQNVLKDFTLTLEERLKNL
jgi:alpha-amylase